MRKIEKGKIQWMEDGGGGVQRGEKKQKWKLKIFFFFFPEKCFLICISKKSYFFMLYGEIKKEEKFMFPNVERERERE